MNKSEYVPGVCNIGDAEIRQRRRMGWIGLVVTVVLALLLEVFHANVLWKGFLVFPAALSTTGFLQAWMHFCAGFGMQGVFNFSSEVYQTDTVAQAEYRALDRKKAIRIFIYSILIGAVVTLIFCLWN